MVGCFPGPAGGKLKIWKYREKKKKVGEFAWGVFRYIYIRFGPITESPIYMCHSWRVLPTLGSRKFPPSDLGNLLGMLGLGLERFAGAIHPTSCI